MLEFLDLRLISLLRMRHVLSSALPLYHFQGSFPLYSSRIASLMGVKLFRSCWVSSRLRSSDKGRGWRLWVVAHPRMGLGPLRPSLCEGNSRFLDLSRLVSQWTTLAGHELWSWKWMMSNILSTKTKYEVPFTGQTDCGWRSRSGHCGLRGNSSSLHVWSLTPDVGP